LPTTKTIFLRFLFVLAALGLAVVACQGPEAFYRGGAGQGDGGSFGTGGTGLVGSGGSPGTGGGVVTGTGGTPATGGTTGTGGKATGGSTGTGGTPATGGTTGTGGRGTGGSPATGGITGTGGRGTGGSPATGGTTGTGGSPATGGTTGAGGSPATGGATGTGGSAATGLVVVDTDCQSAASPQSIGLYLDVLNTSSAAIPLSQITFRYYFQVAETSDPPHLDIDYSTTVPGADITAKFMAISPAVTGANEYMEVGFTTAAGSLQAKSDTQQIQLRVHATNYANPFDSMQTTDYSFQTCAAGRTANTGAFAQQTTITAYVNGVLASGTEPN
jgi:hypothetical protein